MALRTKAGQTEMALKQFVCELKYFLLIRHGTALLPVVALTNTCSRPPSEPALFLFSMQKYLRLKRCDQ